jgi:hypothetical protein
MNPIHPNSTRRHCYYCSQPATTAFYLPTHKAWACPACYMERPTTPSAASGTVVMATEGAIEEATNILRSQALVA